MLRNFIAAFACIASLGLASAAIAGDPAEPLRIIGKDTVFTAKTPDGVVTIKRVMTKCAKNKGWLQPMAPVEGVTPVGEIEVLNSMNDPETLLIDMREIDWYLVETIPTSKNIPYTEVAGRLDELGCKKEDGKWNCADAKKIIAYCNGPVCPQSPTAIRAMHREGFPMDKVMYYRGGMLDWDALGLTTVEGVF